MRASKSIIWLIPIGMTCHAPPFDIRNPFVSMFFYHIILIMAVGTGVCGRVVAGVTGGTLPICPTMIEGKRVVECSIIEVCCVGMTVPACATVMVGGWLVARITILIPYRIVIEVCIVEI